jgi:AraC-like DNA-binding protein
MGPVRFSSRSANEAESVVSRFFEPHVLSRSVRKEIDFQFTHVALSETTSVSKLRYGASVTIKTDHFDDAVMVQMPLAGSNLVCVAEERLHLTPENYSVLVPGGALRQHREADCEMLIFRIKAQRILEYVTSYLGFKPRAALTFSKKLQGAPGPSRRLRCLASLVLEELSGEPHLQPIRSNFEQLFISTLLFEHPNSYSAFMNAAQGGAVPRCVNRAEEFIRANADSTITTGMLARQLNVNARTLQLAFRRFRGCTPMQMVKAIRLELVNRDLLASEIGQATVTDVALRWGFTHFGSFGQAYRARFSEAPSSTLRRKI